MLAMKAQFDGKRVLLPSVPAIHKCPVIIIFEDENTQSQSLGTNVVHDPERDSWMLAQESALSKVWLNDEDAVYDNL